MNTLSIDDILRGTKLGRLQSVGHMQVLPLLGEDNHSFAPPRVEVETTGYGVVVLRNSEERPTIISPGTGWVVEQSAQDHALGGGLLLGAKSMRKILTARCIQSSQCGMIRRGEHPMLVLPAALRVGALATRKQGGCALLWDAIRTFNTDNGVRGDSHLEYFLRHFKQELGRFVAQFELVPRQVGAVVLIGGQVVGLERAPSAEFWRMLWEPLIRVCYGSLAIAQARRSTEPGQTRVPLRPGASSVAQLRARLADAEAEEKRRIVAKLEALRSSSLRMGEQPDQILGTAKLLTLASASLAGQVVQVRAGEVAFASLSTTGNGEAPKIPERGEEPSPVVVAEDVSAPVSTDADQNAMSEAEGRGWGERLRRWFLGF